MSIFVFGMAWQVLPLMAGHTDLPADGEYLHDAGYMDTVVFVNVDKPFGVVK